MTVRAIQVSPAGSSTTAFVEQGSEQALLHYDARGHSDMRQRTSGAAPNDIYDNGAVVRKIASRKVCGRVMRPCAPKPVKILRAAQAQA